MVAQPLSLDRQVRSEAPRLDLITRAPGFLLTTPSAMGTLAAARCLGENGVPVLVLGAERFAPVVWSRFVRHEPGPKVRPIARFLDALIAFGVRNPGHVLYATSDDLAWTFAEWEAVLRRWFRLVTPPFASVVRVLDKRELYAACGEAGVAVPSTWFPESDAEVDRVAMEARFPVIVKPRAQVFFVSARKGIVVTSPGELRSKYKAFACENRYEAAILRERPHMARPMIQELHATEPICSISGFCEPRRGLFVARGARKVLQWPRRAGIGIAFEGTPLDASLAEGVQRLCSVTGFFGIFEAEFVTTGEGMKLIDFNPRLYNQLGFDIARGLPSPYLLHLLALGETSRLEAAVEDAKAWRDRGRVAFRHRSAIAFTRAAERVAGRIPARVPPSLQEGADTSIVEAALDGRDWLPAVVDGLQQFGSVVRHPRAALVAAARGYG